MNSPLLVLDTHILLWTILEPHKVRSSLSDLIEKAQREHKLYIASISLWEIAMLISKRRINVYGRVEDFLKTVVTIKGLTILPLNATIAADSASLLGFHGDPSDGIIVASTREIEGTLVTHDKKILEWAAQGHLRVMAA